MSVDMHDESVATAAVARDGRHILVATYEGRLWWIGLESDDRTLLLEAPVKSGFSAAALSSDGKLSALASYDGSIYLCATEFPAPRIIASDLISRISELRFSDDGLRLALSGAGVPDNLRSLRVQPSLGPHADDRRRAFQKGMAAHTVRDLAPPVLAARA